MKKYCLDLEVKATEHLTERHVLLKLTHSEPLPAMLPGQFVEVRVDDSPSTFLRRPISINYFDVLANEMWLLVAAVGEGTHRMLSLRVGDTLNCVFPLGNSFTLPHSATERMLFVGGGVGVAPLLFAGSVLKARGMRPAFLLGARSAADQLEVSYFEQYGDVYLTTEDGSLGEKGYVTQHSVLRHEAFTRIATCGPKPMMEAVARYAKSKGIACEVSLENLMACGLGACLCCVEKTTQGNVCACTEGPVFDINDLLWQI